jgi:hypothetical protein
MRHISVEWEPSAKEVTAVMMALKSHVDWLRGGECVTCGLRADCNCDAHPHLTTLVLISLKNAGAKDEVVIAVGNLIFGVHPDRVRTAILAYAPTPPPNGPRVKGSN